MTSFWMPCLRQFQRSSEFAPVLSICTRSMTPLNSGESSNGKHVEIRDHGPGLPTGEEERIFEPFHTRKVRGTGLGLALVRRIVTQHGGTIVARNAPEGGAVFRIALPRG